MTILLVQNKTVGGDANKSVLITNTDAQFESVGPEGGAVAVGEEGNEVGMCFSSIEEVTLPETLSKGSGSVKLDGTFAVEIDGQMVPFYFTDAQLAEYFKRGNVHGVEFIRVEDGAVLTMASPYFFAAREFGGLIRVVFNQNENGDVDDGTFGIQAARYPMMLPGALRKFDSVPMEGVLDYVSPSLAMRGLVSRSIAESYNGLEELPISLFGLFTVPNQPGFDVKGQFNLGYAYRTNDTNERVVRDINITNGSGDPIIADANSMFIFQPQSDVVEGVDILGCSFLFGRRDSTTIQVGTVVLRGEHIAVPGAAPIPSIQLSGSLEAGGNVNKVFGTLDNKFVLTIEEVTGQAGSQHVTAYSSGLGTTVPVTGTPFSYPMRTTDLVNEGTHQPIWITTPEFYYGWMTHDEKSFYIKLAVDGTSIEVTEEADVFLAGASHAVVIDTTSGNGLTVAVITGARIGFYNFSSTTHKMEVLAVGVDLPVNAMIAQGTVASPFRNNLVISEMTGPGNIAQTQYTVSGDFILEKVEYTD